MFEPFLNEATEKAIETRLANMMNEYGIDRTLRMPGVRQALDLLIVQRHPFDRLYQECMYNIIRAGIDYKWEIAHAAWLAAHENSATNEYLTYEALVDEASNPLDLLKLPLPIQIDDKLLTEAESVFLEAQTELCRTWTQKDISENELRSTMRLLADRLAEIAILLPEEPEEDAESEQIGFGPR